MATLQELFNMRNDSALRNRVAAAGWNLAKDIFIEDGATVSHAERMIWAASPHTTAGTANPGGCWKPNRWKPYRCNKEAQMVRC